jgi:hypothetical protein
LVLCCLEGLSYDLAASRLGLSEPALRGRLHRARKRLASRLKRRGILTTAAMRLFESLGVPPPAVPHGLFESTVQLASRWASVRGLLAAQCVVPDSVVSLAQGVIRTMLFQSVTSASVPALLVAGLLGTLVAAQQGVKPGAAPAARPTSAPSAVAQNQPRPAPQQPERPDSRALELRSRQILEHLNEPIAMMFPNETPLDDVLKYIKAATTTPTFPGIPIYVDPVGLQEAHASIRSTVQIDIEHQPLKRTLRTILSKLELDYTVKGGFLLISSRSRILYERVEEIDSKLDRLLEAIDRLERSRR